MGTGPNRTQAAIPSSCRVAVIGRGRLGRALSTALRDGAVDVVGPLGRDGFKAESGADVVILCVPDAEIAAAAAALARCSGGRSLVGHCSGASGLDVLGSPDAFSLHPLMTVIGDPAVDAGRLRGAAAAVAGTSDRALAMARALAEAAGMRPIEVDESDRASYHAAASFASNFLVTLEAAAERLAAAAGLERQLLVPLVRATVENWAELGGEHALTGPVARGDEETVARQRAAIAERDPALLGLFDALVQATRDLAGRPSSPSVREAA